MSHLEYTKYLPKVKYQPAGALSLVLGAYFRYQQYFFQSAQKSLKKFADPNSPRKPYEITFLSIF